MSTRAKRKSEGDRRESTPTSLHQTSLLQFTKKKTRTPDAALASSTPNASSSRKANTRKASRGKRQPPTQKENIAPLFGSASQQKADPHGRLAVPTTSNTPHSANSSLSQSGSIPGTYLSYSNDDSGSVNERNVEVARTAQPTTSSIGMFDARYRNKRKAREWDLELIDLSDSDQEDVAAAPVTSKPNKRRKTLSPGLATNPLPVAMTGFSSTRKSPETSPFRTSTTAGTDIPRSSSVVSSSTTSPYYSPLKSLFNDAEPNSGALIASSQSQYLQDLPLIESSQSQYLSPLKSLYADVSMEEHTSPGKIAQVILEDTTTPLHTQLPPSNRRENQNHEATKDTELEDRTITTAYHLAPQRTSTPASLSSSPHQPPSYGGNGLLLSQRPPTPPIITAPGEKIRRRRPGMYSLPQSKLVAVAADDDLPPSSLPRVSSIISLSDDDLGPARQKEDTVHYQRPGKATTNATASLQKPDKNGGSETETDTENEGENDVIPELPPFVTDEDKNPFLDKEPIRNSDLSDRPDLSLPSFQPSTAGSEVRTLRFKHFRSSNEYSASRNADRTLIASGNGQVNSPMHSREHNPAKSKDKNSFSGASPANQIQTGHRRESSETSRFQDVDRTLVEPSLRYDHDTVKSIVRGMEWLSPFKSRGVCKRDTTPMDTDAYVPSQFESQLPPEESMPLMSVPHFWDESQSMGQQDWEPESSNVAMSTRLPTDSKNPTNEKPSFVESLTPKKRTEPIEQDADWPSAVKRFEQQSSPYAGMFGGSADDSSDQSDGSP